MLRSFAPYYSHRLEDKRRTSSPNTSALISFTIIMFIPNVLCVMACLVCGDKLTAAGLLFV